MRRHAAIAFLVLLLGVAPGLCRAPHCLDAVRQRTLREDAADCPLIVYGTLTNPQMRGDEGTTDLLVSGVVKPHPILGGAKVLTLPRYIAVEDPKNPPRMLIFCDIFKGKLDPYRGVVAQPAIVEYLRGLVALDGDRAQVLRFCAAYLEHPDPEIAADAALEFSKASQVELIDAACKVPADKLRAWLRNPQTSRWRLNLYAFLLGQVGRDADYVLLRDLLERRQNDLSPSALDGIFIACVLLRPKEGWADVRALLEKPDSDFLLRYGALRTVRYFQAHPSGVLGRKEVVDAMALAVAHGDMADLAIEDLRRWGTWDLTDRILPLYKKPDTFPIVRKSIVRYALQCPRPEAADLVAEVRKAKPDLVADQEELLKLEDEQTPP
jgi:hypothetical protein